MWKAIRRCCRRQSFDYAPGGGNRCLTSVLSRDSQAVLTVTVFHHMVGVGVCVWEAASAPALPAYRQGVLARVRHLLLKGVHLHPRLLVHVCRYMYYMQIKAFLVCRAVESM